ncbi:MAG: hypothetical protein JXA67_02130, partial [Micromonosporaceae bacterium]|nr:hypothetical protein [Micromonosporaceae bacterium]
DGRGGAAAPPGETLALFADCLLVGAMTAVTVLGVVTAPAGLVAACALLRDRIAADVPVGPRAYWARLRQVAASGLAVVVVPGAVAAVLGLDLLALWAGVPGGRILGVPLALATAAAVLLGLRMAGAWRPGLRWPEVSRVAVNRARTDPGGDVLLLLAGMAAIAIAAIVPLIAVLVPGPLALAVAAIDVRRPW